MALLLHVHAYSGRGCLVQLPCWMQLPFSPIHWHLLQLHPVVGFKFPGPPPPREPDASPPSSITAEDEVPWPFAVPLASIVLVGDRRFSLPSSQPSRPIVVSNLPPCPPFDSPSLRSGSSFVRFRSLPSPPLSGEVSAAPPAWSCRIHTSLPLSTTRTRFRRAPHTCSKAHPFRTREPQRLRRTRVGRTCCGKAGIGRRQARRKDLRLEDSTGHGHGARWHTKKTIGYMVKAC